MRNRKEQMLLLALIVLVFCHSVNAQSYLNYSNLVTAVLTGYNPDIVPLDDHTQALTLKVSGSLYSLLEVDVVKGALTVVIALEASWMDTQIQWTPSSYGNLADITIPTSKVWTPSFILGSPADFTTVGESWMPVTFLSNGTASVAFGDVVNSVCNFNLKFWPFDKHTCDVSFIVYGFPLNKLRLESQGVTAYNLDDNIEWVVTETSAFVEETEGLSEVIFRIGLQRRTPIFIILIIFPLYTIACLNVFVFLLPQESGTRMDFSTTLLLSTTVFLDTISDYIPNTSKPIPLLCIVVTLGVTMSIVCIMFVMLSMNLYYKSDDEPVRKSLVKFVKLMRRITGKCRRRKVADEREVMTIEKKNSSMNDKSKLQSTKVDIIHDNDNTGDASDETDVTWKDVAATIDKVILTFTFMTHSLILMICTFYMIFGSK